MVGYPEALTDPSYQGQILALTYPLVGNYGVPQFELDRFGILKCFESDRVRVRGLIVHELCERPSHWSSSRSLHEWLFAEGIPGLGGVDTRRLTRLLRAHGVLLGTLFFPEYPDQTAIGDLRHIVNSIEDPNKRDLVAEVSVQAPVTYGPQSGARVVLIDCGVKHSIIRHLRKRDLTVIRVPYNTPAEGIFEYDPKGVVLSNGPGDPTICADTIRATKTLLESGIPIMGICLGVQILALALGAKTFKLKYGHRSQNQPVVDCENGRAYVTTQNHGYAVDRDSLEASGAKLWFLNANDHTVEGFRLTDKPVFAVQWHPEASPGPRDTEFLFDDFAKLVR